VHITSPLGNVFAHLPTFKQILTNLISNSIKFLAPQRPPEIKIFTPAGPSFVRLWIQDNGIGIAPESRQRIFAMFQRLNRPELYEGTGMGLAIVRKAIERMGGRIGVESELGKGSRFWIELPQAKNDEPADTVG